MDTNDWIAFVGGGVALVGAGSQADALWLRQHKNRASVEGGSALGWAITQCYRYWRATKIPFRDRALIPVQGPARDEEIGRREAAGLVFTMLAIVLAAVAAALGG